MRFRKVIGNIYENPKLLEASEQEVDFLMTQIPNGSWYFKAVSERAKNIQWYKLMSHDYPEWFPQDNLMERHPEFIYKEVDNSYLL